MHCAASAAVGGRAVQFGRGQQPILAIRVLCQSPYLRSTRVEQVACNGVRCARDRRSTLLIARIGRYYGIQDGGTPACGASAGGRGWNMHFQLSDAAGWNSCRVRTDRLLMRCTSSIFLSSTMFAVRGAAPAGGYVPGRHAASGLERRLSITPQSAKCAVSVGVLGGSHV